MRLPPKKADSTPGMICREGVCVMMPGYSATGVADAIALDEAAPESAVATSSTAQAAPSFDSFFDSHTFKDPKKREWEAKECVVDDGAPHAAQVGRCKSWNLKKGFGFISYTGRDGKHNEIFVHQLDVVKHGFRKLEPGEKVEFHFAKSKRSGRMKAVRASPLPERLMGSVRPTAVRATDEDELDELFDDLFSP